MDLAVSLEFLADKLDVLLGDRTAEIAAVANEQDDGKPVVIRSYRDLTEAMVDRTILESVVSLPFFKKLGKEGSETKFLTKAETAGKPADVNGQSIG